MEAMSFYKNCLLERVGSSECMLQVIPLNRIKHFVSQQIDELDLNRCKKLYYTQMPMDEIFPSDIIQYILSFDGLYHTKAVSKKWKQYSEQNEQNHLTKLYSSINEIKSPVQYDETINKTYIIKACFQYGWTWPIIDQHRKKLHKIEIDLGYKGPMEDINKTLSICNSGDRLLVHDGVYTMPRSRDFNGSISNNIQLIGVGAAVTIKSYWWYFGNFGNEEGTATECDIRNIKFDCSGNSSNMVSVGKNATLHLENCEFTCGYDGVVVCAEYGSHLDINNCRFINHYGSNIAIELSPFAKEVNIIDCTFENCGIKISENCGIKKNTHYRVHDEMVQLKCVGNIFDLCNNSLGDFHPITEIHTRTLHHNYVHSDRYTLRDNVAATENDQVNPNKIMTQNKKSLFNEIDCD